MSCSLGARTVALASLYLGLPIHALVGMTGVATLSGPVGEVLGLQSKAMALILGTSDMAQVRAATSDMGWFR